MIHNLLVKAFIPNPKGKRCIDHANNDKLNNNVSNLRWSTHSENNQNASISKRNTSGVRGVTFNKSNKKWRVQIKLNGKYKHLGLFTSLKKPKLLDNKLENFILGNFRINAKKCQ